MKHHSKNVYTYVGVEVKLHIFLTSALDRGVFSFTLWSFHSRGRVMERKCVGNSRLEALECRKDFCFDRQSNMIHYNIARILFTALTELSEYHHTATVE